MILLDVHRLVVRFGTDTAVDDVSFSVAAGETVGLVGANGAGKTTAIRAALGLQQPSSGSVRLLGEAPSRRARRSVGYVPQTLGLWQDLTVRQNLAFIAAAYGVAAPELPDDLAATAGQLVSELPLGPRRRIAFEAALTHDPGLLVLDEPTSGVGPLERTHLWDRIHQARDDGAGVLITTHHMSEAEQCDRVVALMQGQVRLSGTMAALLDDQETVVVDTDDWAAAFTRLDAAFPGVALAGHTIRIPDTSPEQVRTVLGGHPARLHLAPASFDEVFVAMGQRG